MLYLTEREIAPLIGMKDAVDAVERAFRHHGAGTAVDGARQRTKMPGAQLNVLQAGSLTLGVVGFKAYYVLPGGRTSVIQLIDRATGALIAIVEAHWLGRMRTGAATGVAARHLAAPDASTVAMFGSGRQAAAQLEALRAVRPITQARVYSRRRDRLEAFCRATSKSLDFDVRPADSPAAAVDGAQIIVTITRGEAPAFDGALLRPGQLVAAAGVNAIDRRELDNITVDRADLVVVDSRDTARTDCGDLVTAIEAGRRHWNRLPELGEIIVGKAKGRESSEQIVLFESHGMALQDLYCAMLVVERATAHKLGQAVVTGYTD